MRGNAEAMGHGHNIFRPHGIGELGRNHIERKRQSGSECHFTHVFVFVVFRFPIANADWLIYGNRLRCVAFFHGCKIDKRLESGARLAERLGDAIILAALV